MRRLDSLGGGSKIFFKNEVKILIPGNVLRRVDSLGGGKLVNYFMINKFQLFHYQIFPIRARKCVEET